MPARILIKKFLLLLTVFFISAYGFAQCEVSKRITATGAMYYYTPTVLFYKTTSFQLSGNVVTDRENYFLRLKPFPFVEKQKRLKIKTDLQVKLSNDTTYTLSAYDSWYNEEDSSFTLMYMFKEDDVPFFLNNKVVEISINTDNTSAKTYNFKLHPDVIQIQLACFIQKKTAF